MMTVLYLQVGNSGVYWVPHPPPDWACACHGPDPDSLPGECGCDTFLRKHNEELAIVGLNR